MLADFPFPDQAAAQLSATRQGRVSLGGFAYQTAFAVGRVASLAARVPLHDLPDIPDVVRFDWAEDLDELLEDGSAVFTQCKRIADAGQPARVAGVITGFAPKLLWTPAGRRAAVTFRLVSPDTRFGRGFAAATELRAAERDAARRAVLETLKSEPAKKSDRVLWQDDADAFGHAELFEAIWSRLQFAYADDTVLPLDPAGTVFSLERDALNLLLAMQLCDQAQQRPVAQALRTIVHGNVIKFDPNGLDPVSLTPRPPRRIDHADVSAALIAFRPGHEDPLPFQVVGRVFLEQKRLEDKSRFVARLPRWKDVVHGEDAALGFFERDVTADLCQRARQLMTESEDADATPALFVVGAPGAGKSTLTRRVAAILALEGECTVADPGPRLDAIDEDEMSRAVMALAHLGSTERPVLLLLDDPFFAKSPWPELLRRLRPLARITVLGASPTLLLDRHASDLPKSLRVERWELGAPSLDERRRLATLHQLDETTFDDQSEDLLVLAMEAATGEPFADIIQRIWTTLNDGTPIRADTPPADLPWLVRAYLIVCYFHRHYVRPREPLLRAALQAAGPVPPLSQLAYELSQLVSDGWNIFTVDQPRQQRIRWAGPSIAAAHARIARAAWDARPVQSFDVAEWVATSAVMEPAGAFEMGALAASLLADEAPEAASLIDKLSSNWLAAIKGGDAEVRNLALFVGGGKRLDRRFPGLTEVFRAALDTPGPQAWIAAYQLYLSSSDDPRDRSYPEDVAFDAVVEAADFSVADQRGLGFSQSVSPGTLSLIKRRFREALDGHAGWTPHAGALTAWFIAHEPADEIENRLGALLGLAAVGRPGYGALAALLARSHDYSLENARAIVHAVTQQLRDALGDPSARILAGAVQSASKRLSPEHPQMSDALEELKIAFADWQSSISSST